MSRYIEADNLNLYDELFMKGKNDSGVWVRYRDVENLIKNAHTADVQEVKHASWIKDERRRRDDGAIYDYCCSLCRGAASKGEYGNYDIFTDFCPHCGAKMDGDEND